MARLGMFFLLLFIWLIRFRFFLLIWRALTIFLKRNWGQFFRILVLCLTLLVFKIKWRKLVCVLIFGMPWVDCSSSSSYELSNRSNKVLPIFNNILILSDVILFWVIIVYRQLFIRYSQANFNFQMKRSQNTH